MNEDKLIEKRIDGENIFSGVILNVKKDKVELPNGNVATREVIRHNGAVAIVAMTDDGKVCVERQYRYPVNEVITEIPAGKLNSKQEDRLDAAKRELREETGIIASNWKFVGTYYPAAAYSDEVITIYLATGLKQGEQELDDDEFLNVEFVPINDLIKEIMDDKIPDGKTQMAILKVAHQLNIL